MLKAIEFNRGGVVCIYAADTNLQDVLGAIRQYLTHPNCSEFQFIIHDFSTVESFTFSDVEFSEMANYAIENLHHSDYVPRCAVTENDTVKRCMDLYAEITGRTWVFFASLESACAWVHSRWKSNNWDCAGAGMGRSGEQARRDFHCLFSFVQICLANLLVNRH